MAFTRLSHSAGVARTSNVRIIKSDGDKVIPPDILMKDCPKGKTQSIALKIINEGSDVIWVADVKMLPKLPQEWEDLKNIFAVHRYQISAMTVVQVPKNGASVNSTCGPVPDPVKTPGTEGFTEVQPSSPSVERKHERADSGHHGSETI